MSGVSSALRQRALDARGRDRLRLARPAGQPAGRCILFSTTLIVLVLLGAVPGRAQAQPGEEAAAAVRIASMADFWTLDAAEKLKPQTARIELTVRYYDPIWKLLWGDTAGSSTYVPVGGAPLPIRAGQRVLLEGTVVPAVGFGGDTIRVTVLAEQAGGTPVTVAGRLGEVVQLNASWITLEGYVCEQRELDRRHFYFGVVSEGRLITARLLLGDTDPVPQLVDARVRLRGVYVAAADPQGHVREINLWVARPADIEVLEWLEQDARFALPATPLEALGACRPGEWVRVAGVIRGAQPGESVTVRDDTGQLVIATAQPGSFPIGVAVDVVGCVQGGATAATLVDPIIRPRRAGRGAAGTPAARGTGALFRLRLAAQVLELGPDEAARRHPVDVRGVVTWWDAAAGFLFLQDASGGVRVHHASGGGAREPSFGRVVEIEGVTATGAFAPELVANKVTDLGGNSLLPRRVITLEQAMTGAEEGRWVEMRGYVRQVVERGALARLEVTTALGEFAADIASDPSLVSLTGAVVRISGVCVAEANAQRQLTGVRLLVGNRDDVRIEEPAPADTFAAPERTIASLRQFAAMPSIDRRVRVAGTVLHKVPGRYLYLQDGDAAVLVLCRDQRSVAPGDGVEVVGFPGREGARVVLREGAWRRRTTLPSPLPRRLEASVAIDPDADGRLAIATVRLADTNRGPDGVRLVCDLDGRRFDAWLPATGAIELPPAGSVVELTGVCVVEHDEYRRPQHFRMQLRSVGDVRLVRAAPWWTARRIGAMAGVLGLGSIGVVGWVVVLRRRVRQQTEQIRTQMEREAGMQAELERSSRLESLGVLAGGIAHDFNNLLTVVIANLGLARMETWSAPGAATFLQDAERGARRAAELTQQLLTFSRGGDPVRAAVELPDVVREAAEFGRHGSSVRCEFDFPPALPPANVDRAQISRVVHNLVLNAAQAMPTGGVVRLALREAELAAGEVAALPAGRYIQLSVTDQGGGIAPEHLPRIFDPYFSTKPRNSGLGLATVHSIVKKHQGHIAVESEAGESTTFRIWLPAADAPAAAATAPRLDRSTMRGGARVLFMDDEEIIRRTAAVFLERMGHQATLVGDGAAAVAAYREARAAGRPFDAVVLDLTVPGGMGGRAAIEALREIDPQVRAIVCSGYSADPVLSNYRAFGFKAMVPKPYEVQDLAHAISDVVAGRGAP